MRRASDLTRPLTYGEQIFLCSEEAKAAIRAMVRSQEYEAGVPAAQRGPLIEKLTAELADLKAAEERLVDD